MGPPPSCAPHPRSPPLPHHPGLSPTSLKLNQFQNISLPSPAALLASLAFPRLACQGSALQSLSADRGLQARAFAMRGRGAGKGRSAGTPNRMALAWRSRARAARTGCLRAAPRFARARFHKDLARIMLLDMAKRQRSSRSGARAAGGHALRPECRRASWQHGIGGGRRLWAVRVVRLTSR